LISPAQLRDFIVVAREGGVLRLEVNGECAFELAPVAPTVEPGKTRTAAEEDRDTLAELLNVPPDRIKPPPEPVVPAAGE
jgi:hypothetical protein